MLGQVPLLGGLQPRTIDLVRPAITATMPDPSHELSTYRLEINHNPARAFTYVLYRSKQGRLSRTLQALEADLVVSV